MATGGGATLAGSDQPGFHIPSLFGNKHKYKVYDRTDDDSPKTLEGMTFQTPGSAFGQGGAPIGFQTGSASGLGAASAKTTAAAAAAGGPKMTLERESSMTLLPPAEDDKDKEFDLGDLPERLSDTAGLGNIPELTLLLEDDEVIDKFEDEDTAMLLREISMDPSKLEELKKEPQIQWMLNKIEEKRRLIRTEEKYRQYRK